jgi:IMP dehydrogenase
LGRLRVAAATTVGDAGFERSEALVDAGCDLIVIDTAHGHSEGVARAVERVKTLSNEVQVVAGNVATAEATRALIDAGADAVKVGIGPGSICTTRIVAGVGVPQLTAIMDCAAAAAGGAPVIADGGIKFPAISPRRSRRARDCAMVGSMIAGTDESPRRGDPVPGPQLQELSRHGQLGAMARGSADRYFQKDAASDKLVPEGIEGQVPYKGSAGHGDPPAGRRPARGDGLYRLRHDRRDAARAAASWITGAGLKESHVHDVQITRESPNYRGLRHGAGSSEGPRRLRGSRRLWRWVGWSCRTCRRSGPWRLLPGRPGPILDYCAGGGGKALAIADRTGAECSRP